MKHRGCYLGCNSLPNDAVDDNHAQQHGHGLALILDETTAPGRDSLVDVTGAHTLHGAASALCTACGCSRRSATHGDNKNSNKLRLGRAKSIGKLRGSADHRIADGRWFVEYDDILEYVLWSRWRHFKRRMPNNGRARCLGASCSVAERFAATVLAAKNREKKRGVMKMWVG